MADTDFPGPPTSYAQGQSCANCDYRFIVPSETDRLNLHMECRRYAPRPAPGTIMYWPIVQTNDWCGEWKLG